MGILKYQVHCFINLFTFFDVYFEMNRIKNDANTLCIQGVFGEESFQKKCFKK